MPQLWWFLTFEAGSRNQPHRRPGGRTVVTIAIIALAYTPTAAAQERVYQGAYEGAGVDPARRILGVSLAVAGGYDAFEHRETPIGLLDQFQLPGFFTTVAPMATLQSKGTHVNVEATAGTNGRYYGEARRFVSVNHYATASIGAQITPQTNLFVGMSASYSPAYLNRIFSTLGPSNTLGSASSDPSIAADLAARTTDEGLSDVHSYAYGGTVNLTRKITRRGSVTLTAGGRYTRFVRDEPTIPDLKGFEGGGYYTYSLDRNNDFRLGYQYREAHYSPTLDSTEHGLDLGFGHTHVWSKTRRTFFAISAGPRAVRQSPRRVPTAVPGEFDGGILPDASTQLASAIPAALTTVAPQLSVVGGALLDHQIGRTWTLHGGAHRDVAYIEALPNPVFTNTIDLSTSGFLTRRIDVTASFGRSYGDSSLSFGTRSPFSAYNGYLRVRTAFGRRWAGYGELVYDAYHFEGDAPVPLGISRKMTRSGVRGGLMLWMPVVRQR